MLIIWFIVHYNQVLFDFFTPTFLLRTVKIFMISYIRMQYCPKFRKQECAHCFFRFIFSKKILTLFVFLCICRAADTRRSRQKSGLNYLFGSVEFSEVYLLLNLPRHEHVVELLGFLLDAEPPSGDVRHLAIILPVFDGGSLKSFIKVQSMLLTHIVVLTLIVFVWGGWIFWTVLGTPHWIFL